MSGEGQRSRRRRRGQRKRRGEGMEGGGGEMQKGAELQHKAFGSSKDKEGGDELPGVLLSCWCLGLVLGLVFVMVMVERAGAERMLGLSMSSCLLQGLGWGAGAGGSFGVLWRGAWPRTGRRGR